MPTTARAASCAHSSGPSRSWSPKGTSRRSTRRWRSAGAPQRVSLGLGERLGGAARLGATHIRSRVAEQRPHPDSSALGAGRSRPRGRSERGMKMEMSRDRGDRPRLLGRGTNDAMSGAMGRHEDRPRRPGRPTQEPPRPASRTRTTPAMAPRRDEHVILRTRTGGQRSGARASVAERWARSSLLGVSTTCDRMRQACCPPSLPIS